MLHYKTREIKKEQRERESARRTRVKRALNVIQLKCLSINALFSSSEPLLTLLSHRIHLWRCQCATAAVCANKIQTFHFDAVAPVLSSHRHKFGRVRARVRLEFSIIRAIEFFELNSPVKIHRQNECERERAIKRTMRKWSTKKRRAALISIQRTLKERRMEYLEKAIRVLAVSCCEVNDATAATVVVVAFLRLCHRGGNWKTARQNNWNVYAWEPVNGSLRVQFKI